jgi:hypothetical protein
LQNADVASSWKPTPDEAAEVSALFA